MLDLRQLGPEQLEALNQLEAEVRLRLNPPNREVSLMILGARMSAGMGRSLENTCPYYRKCRQQKDESCIGSDNYRPRQCYRINLFGENDTRLVPIVTLTSTVGATV